MPHESHDRFPPTLAAGTGAVVSSWELLKHIYKYERSLSSWQDLALRNFSSVCRSRRLEAAPGTFQIDQTPALLGYLYQSRLAILNLLELENEPVLESDPGQMPEHSAEGSERIAAMLNELRLVTTEAREAAAAAREAVAELRVVENSAKTLGHLAGRFEGNPLWRQLDDVTRDYWQDEDAR